MEAIYIHSSFWRITWKALELWLSQYHQNKYWHPSIYTITISIIIQIKRPKKKLTWDPTRAFWKALRTRVVLCATKLSTALNSEYKESTASATCSAQRLNHLGYYHNETFKAWRKYPAPYQLHPNPEYILSNWNHLYINLRIMCPKPY